ncbi:hypothetical protein A0256_19115 [Mucilaginibacter sp. PAMC 26640]|nr:hypothetical protein A0256_19115 [Mucilaginibacter sp. PAMC 26640]
MKANALTVTIKVDAPIEKVWELWTTPYDIKKWNNLSPDWHTTHVENDLRTGGRFLYKMGLKDGSFSFNFEGTYEEVMLNKLITYTLNDQRHSRIEFSCSNPVVLSEIFEPTDNEPAQVQEGFCKAVLQSFKQYTEAM